MLIFASSPKASFQVIDIYKILDNTLAFLNHLHQGNGVRFITRHEERPFMVQGDPELLTQVFLNLSLNAMQAIPECGSVTIETRTKLWG